MVSAPRAEIMPDITPLPLLRQTASGLEQCVRVEFLPDQIRRENRCGIRVRRRGWESAIDLGVLPSERCVRMIFLPEPAGEVSTEFTTTCGESLSENTLRMGPVRRWTVHVVLHSHTDLGFTHPVSDVARIHNENTDLALRYCRETADWPEGSRFKWTCEVTWQVRNYLRDRGGEDFENLMQWVRRGSIGVGALHSGVLTGLLGHEEAVRSFALAGFLRRTYGIPCDTALLCDVPGCAEGFVQVMAKSGVRNLIIADNNFLAPFLPRTDLPRPFLWQGEGGTEVLAWYTDHPYYAYVEGEYYGLLEGVETVEERLVEKLRALESQGYPYERYQIQYAFDNALLSTRPLEVVREWNELWAYPRLVLSTAREFLEHLRAREGDSFPRRRGDWSDWWGGIVAGFPREESLTRRCHGRAPATEFFATQAALRTPNHPFPAAQMSGVYDGLLSFDEHSGGGALWRPPSQEKQDRAVREGYGVLYGASSSLDSLEGSTGSALARCIDNPGDGELVAAFNASPFAVSASVRVPGRPGHTLVEDIPPWGYRTVALRERPRTEEASETSWGDITGGRDGTLEGFGYRLQIDSATGACRSLFDKELRRELVRKRGSLNEIVVYVVHPIKEVELGKYIPEIYDGRPHPGEFLARPPASRVRLALSADGNACRATHMLGGVPWLTQEYRLSEKPRGIQITNIIPRRVRDDARLRGALNSFLPRRGLLYVRFAFDVPGGIFEYEATGMVQRPGESQFRGACRDFFPVQKWCRIVGNGQQVILALPDTPLVDVGSAGLMRFKEILDSDQSELLVRTVDLRDWGGEAESPYSKGEDIVIRFAVGAGVESRTRAAQFAAEAFPLLLAGVVPPGCRGSLPSGTQVFCRAPDNVDIMTVKPAEEGAGLVLRVRETAGVETVGTITFPDLKLRRVRRAMLTEEPLEELSPRGDGMALRLPPFGIETFLLDVEVNRP